MWLVDPSIRTISVEQLAEFRARTRPSSNARPRVALGDQRRVRVLQNVQIST
jgi:hypothetical protein